MITKCAELVSAFFRWWFVPLCSFLRALWSQSFGKTLIVFAILEATFQTVMLIPALREISWMSKYIVHQGVDRAQTTFLAISVQLLVVANTFFFLRDALGPYEHLCKLTMSEKGKVRNNYWHFFGLLILSVFVSGLIVLGLVIGSMFFVAEVHWASLLVANEVLTIVLFFAFVLADAWCISACNIALQRDSGLDDEGRQEVVGFRRDLMLYMYASDVPGLLGMLVILFVSGFSHHLWTSLYWQGFITGAIGLHIAFSQATVALLGVARARIQEAPGPSTYSAPTSPLLAIAKAKIQEAATRIATSE